MSKMPMKSNIVKCALFAASMLSACIWLLSGCAAPRVAAPVPEISPNEMMDSLVAGDKLVRSAYLKGKGKFTSGGTEETFMVNLLASRPDRLIVNVLGPLGLPIAILWLCGQDSLCIYLPSRNAVLVEPLGADMPGMILPPAAPILVDMFCGMAPIARFAHALQNFEKTSDGHFLTFKTDRELLIAFAKPQPWHIESFEWAKLANTSEQVSVEFEDGEIRDDIWRPGKIIITSPALGQVISVNITRDEINPSPADSLFVPKIPPNAVWQNAF